jgi:RimJ/RimL family protein N-acetyltransferase
VVGLLDFVGGTLPEEVHSGLFGLSVSRDHRGHGIGSALVQELLMWAPTRGISRVEVRAWVSNPRALALYERLGFEREGVLRNAVVVDGEPIDVVVLSRLLEALGG